MKIVQWNKQVSICAHGTMVFIQMLWRGWRCSVNHLNKTLDGMILDALSFWKPANRFRQCPSTWDTEEVLKQHGKWAEGLLFGLIHASCYYSHLSLLWWPQFVFSPVMLHRSIESALTDIKYTCTCVLYQAFHDWRRPDDTERTVLGNSQNTDVDAHQTSVIRCLGHVKLH